MKNNRSFFSSLMLFIGTFMMLFGASRAFAADFIDVPATDVSLNAIDFIFGVTYGDETVNVLGTAMKFWNLSMMLIGAIIVGYILIAGVLKTAHDGEALGRQWNSMWIPFRASVGLAMTAPVLKGYSAIQLLVIWSAIQGIGIADTIWEEVLKAMRNNGGFVVAPPPSYGEAEVVRDIYKSALCVAAANLDIARDSSSAGRMLTADDPGMRFGISAYEISSKYSYEIDLSPTKTIGVSFGNISGGSNKPPHTPYNSYPSDACGKFEWSKSVVADVGQETGNSAIYGGTSQVVDRVTMSAFDLTKGLRELGDPIVQAQRAGIIDAYKELQKIAEKRIYIDANGEIKHGLQPTAADFLPAMKAYHDSIVKSIGLVKGFAQQQGLDKFYDGASKDGWAMAGAYYMRLGQFNKAASEVLRETHSETENELFSMTESDEDLLPITAMAIKYANEDFDYITKEMKPGSALMSSGNTNLSGADGGLIGYFNAMIFGLTNEVVGLMSGNGAVASAQGNFRPNMDPISSKQAMGHYILDFAWAGMIASGVMSVTPAGKAASMGNKLSDSKIGKMLKSEKVSGFLASLCMPLMIAAVFLAFVLPMMPYFLMTFSVMSWLTSLFISVIAAPLWAISHATPDGHDAFGHGSNGYILLMSVVTRPALTILAMVGSISILIAMDFLITQGFMVAFRSSQATSIIGPIGFVAAVVMYTVFSLVIIYGCFRLVQTVPNSILSWVGGRDDDSIGAEGHNDRTLAVISSSTSTVSQASAAALAQGKKAKMVDSAVKANQKAANKDLSVGQANKNQDDLEDQA